VFQTRVPIAHRQGRHTISNSMMHRDAQLPGTTVASCATSMTPWRSRKRSARARMICSRSATSPVERCVSDMNQVLGRQGGRVGERGRIGGPASEVRGAAAEDNLVFGVGLLGDLRWVVGLGADLCDARMGQERRTRAGRRQEWPVYALGGHPKPASSGHLKTGQLM
jgi:hypothetical protein